MKEGNTMAVSKNDYCVSENRMVDTKAITSAMNRLGVSGQELADLLGVSLRTIRNRLKWGNWTVAEAYIVSRLLGLDFHLVFLAHPEKLDQYPVEQHPVSRRGYGAA